MWTTSGYHWDGEPYKKPYQASKDKDWQTLVPILESEMHKCLTPEEVWDWYGLIGNDHQIWNTFPPSWKQTFKEFIVLPYVDSLIVTIIWEDERTTDNDH